jgi:hypothetical protein
MSLSDTKTRVALIVLALLACGAVAWSLLGSDSSPAAEAKAAKTDAGHSGPDISVEALKKADPIEVMRLFRRDDLTEEEKDRLLENAREARREMMAERITRYFEAEGEKRTAILDEQIDEWLAMQERMRRAMEENPPTQDMRERWRQRWMNREAPTRAERKQAFESGRSEERSRMMAYFQAARARMQERGLQMPRGPWGHGGGNRGNNQGDSRNRPPRRGHGPRTP